MVTWRAKTAILALSVLNLNVMCNRSPAEGGKDPEAAAAEGPVQLAQVDTSGLTDRERKQWSAHVSELLAPCTDQPVNLVQCINEKRPCDACLPAARFLVNQVKQGKARGQVDTAFRLRFAPDEVQSVDISGSPWKGAADAPVTIVEWADFECPFCAAASPRLDEVVQRFQPNVKLVFKNYPLSAHEHAELAARASVAAFKQNKFWEMHSKLFENQHGLERKSLLRFAKELGLDEKKFVADLDSEAVADAVQNDRKQAEKLQLRGTPLIYINGRRFETDSFNLLDDLDEWLKLEVRMLTGRDFEPAPTEKVTEKHEAAPDEATAIEPASGGAAGK